MPERAASHVVGFQSSSVYTFLGTTGGAEKSTTAAQLLVMTTLLTVGACALTDFKTSKVPLIAGSRNSRLLEMTRYKKGDAVWMTKSNGGFDLTTSSNAPGEVMSGTMPKSS